MDHLGTFLSGATVAYWFNTQSVDQTPGDISSGALRAFKQGSDTEDDSGLTLTAPYDSVTGLNAVLVDTATDTTFYSGPAEFTVYLSAGTVAGVSVVGTKLFSFRISNSQNPAGVVSALTLTTNFRQSSQD